MKVTVKSYEDSEPDCLRYTYYTKVDGKEYCLSACALGSYYTYLEILERVENLFGKDVEIEFDCYIQTKQLELKSY